MNIKGILVILGTTIPAMLLSAGIVFLIAFFGDMLPSQRQSRMLENITSVPTENAPTMLTLSDNAVIEPATQAPTRDYSYPQEFITVDNAYFNNAVFLGDSRMSAFIKYSGLTGLRAYSYMGLTVEKYFSDKTFQIENCKFSASEALELDRSFDKVYLMFGTNELGWPFPDVFIKKYKTVIEHIKKCNPDAVIFVNSVLPVSEYAFQKKDFLRNETVYVYNELLEQMAKEQEVYFLDLASVVANENGALPLEASTDGIHPNKTYVQKCFDFMRSHGIEPKPKEIISEKPLEVNNWEKS